MNHSMKLYNGQQKTIQRRERVITRLEKQLKTGLKCVEPKNLLGLPNPNDIGDGTLPLLEKDIKRINKELITLKSRLIWSKTSRKKSYV